jgi:hypothetical protein
MLDKPPLGARYASSFHSQHSRDLSGERLGCWKPCPHALSAGKDPTVRVPYTNDKGAVFGNFLPCNANDGEWANSHDWQCRAENASRQRLSIRGSSFLVSSNLAWSPDLAILSICNPLKLQSAFTEIPVQLWKKWVPLEWPKQSLFRIPIQLRHIISLSQPVDSRHYRQLLRTKVRAIITA